MWDTIVRLIAGLFKSDQVHEAVRADFATIAQSWESFAMRIDQRCSHLEERLNHAEGALKRCEEEHEIDRRLVEEQNSKIAVLSRRLEELDEKI